MLHLYDVDKNKIAPLTNVKNVRVEKELNGDSSLLFSYPITGPYYNEIVEESYIRTKENEYIVKEIHELDEWTEIKCLLNVEDLEGKPFEHFEMVNSRIEDTINTALAGTGWTVGHCDVTKRRTVRKAMCSSWDIIQDARKVYRCDITFDTLNKKVHIYNKLGEDKGVYFTDELNLRRLEIQRDSYNFCTRIIPIGKDGMTIKDVNNGKEYVENHQYSNKIITKYWEDNRYTVPENLRDDAQSKVDEMSKPYISYKADVIDLASISNEYNVLDYNLGDTITLMNKRFKVKEKQRIVKIVEWLYEPERNTVEIANRTASFEDIQRNFEETSDMVDSVTTSDGMIDESKVNFNPIRQEFEHVIAQKADIVDLNAANARIGNLEATKANITDLDAINARIDNLYAEDLSAINADIINLQARVGEIDTILAMEVFAELIEVGEIRAGSGIIADGAIGDAQISYLTAGKIASGTIDTSLVTVAGADGKLNITGNRLQVINDGKERVALGDVNRDGTVYGLRVRGEDGETVLFDERGITREGITEGSIDDSKVGDDANIQGHKLDINSVIREVNEEGTETIKGTRVQVGDRTLDVELSTLESNITENATEINHQRGLIQALDDKILLKVDRQEFTQYKSTTDEEIGLINTQLSKNTSSIDILQEQIKLKVEQVDIENAIADMEIGGRNLLRGTSSDYQSFSMSNVWWKPLPNGERKTLYEWGVSPGDTLTLRIYINPVNGYGGNARFSFYRADGTYTQPIGNIITANTGEGYSTLTKIIPDDCTEMAVGIQNEIPNTGTTYDVDIKEAKLEKGNKATDWTPAPEDVDAEFTKINTQLAEIDINLKSITSRVQETEYDIDNVTNKVTMLEQTAEDFSISIRKYEDGIFEGATYTFDGRNATFRAAGLKIQNDFGEDVFKADTLGDLSIIGDFTTYVNGNKAIDMVGNSIRLFDHESLTNRDPVGRLTIARRHDEPNKPNIQINHGLDAAVAFGFLREKYGYDVYMDLDYHNILGGDSKYPIRVRQNTQFDGGVNIDGSTAIESEIQLGKSTIQSKPGGNYPNRLEVICDNHTQAGYTLKTTTNRIVWQYRPRGDDQIWHWLNTRIRGNLSVVGSKNALVETENYGKRLLNALETPEYYFQDRGSGKTGEDGYCYIYVDDIFDETVNTDMQYHVEIQEYGEGTLRPIERNPKYFVVKGTPNIDFGWTLTAKRRGYEYHRLETPDNFEEEEETNIDYLIESEEEKQNNEELEETIEEELTFDLADYVLGGDE